MLLEKLQPVSCAGASKKSLKAYTQLQQPLMGPHTTLLAITNQSRKLKRQVNATFRIFYTVHSLADVCH